MFIRQNELKKVGSVCVGTFAFALIDAGVSSCRRAVME